VPDLRLALGIASERDSIRFSERKLDGSHVKADSDLARLYERLLIGIEACKGLRIVPDAGLRSRTARKPHRAQRGGAKEQGCFGLHGSGMNPAWVLILLHFLVRIDY
jgi:hypothetical protein